MSTHHTVPPDDENRIYDQIRNETKPGQDGDYQAWLAEDARRQEKDTFVRSLWNDAAFEDALRLVEGNTSYRTKSKPRFSTVGWAAAAASVVFVALMFNTWPGPTNPEPTSVLTYKTEPRKIQQQTLADGSMAELSPITKVQVRYSPDQRQIHLLEGEARFSVARDANRPFSVETRHARMQALGTVFNVDQRGAVTELSVYEGRVSITPVDNARERRVLTAGQRLTATPEGLQDITHFDPAQDRHWLNGWVSVESMPLSQLLIKLNRFATTPVHAGDSKTEELLVSGVFDLNKPDKNLQILATLHQLDIQRDANSVTLSQP